MEEVKKCQRCGVVVSTCEGDYYRHIRVKYCDTCRPEIEREQAAWRQATRRAKKKERVRLLNEQNALLREENELLRKRVQELRNGGAESDRS